LRCCCRFRPHALLNIYPSPSEAMDGDARHGHAFARVCRCPPGTAHVSASLPCPTRVSYDPVAAERHGPPLCPRPGSFRKGVVSRRGGSRRNGDQIDLRVDWFTGIRNLLHPRSSRRLHSPITPADLRYYNKTQGVRIHWWHTCTGVCLSGGRNIEGTPRSTSETTP
jgi:hypothetical protein